MYIQFIRIYTYTIVKYLLHLTRFPSISKKQREGRWEGEREREEERESSTRFHHTVTTALHDALKLQSTRKTMNTASRNYSKRRSLRSRPVQPPSSSYLSCSPFKSHLSLKRRTLRKRIRARLMHNGPTLRRLASREKLPLSFLYKTQ